MSAPAGAGAGGDRPLGAISELTYENKTCSECRQDVSKAETQAARQTDRLTERQKDRQKTEVLFSFIIKTKVAKNVNRMSER